MAEVRWTLQAADDFEAIIEFISHDSPSYARMLAIEIMQAIEQISVFPHSGRIVPETESPDCRELIIGNYRLIYRIKPDLAEIITIIHSARLLNQNRLQ